MVAFTKRCDCGRRFRTLNPFRARCDVCEENAWLNDFVLAATVSDGMREFYRDLLEREGIPSLFKTTALARYGAGPSVQLWLRRRDLEAAANILGPDVDVGRPGPMRKTRG